MCLSACVDHIVCISLAVPQPTVSLISNPPNPILSGSSSSLTCTVELSPAVDVPVSISIVWTAPEETYNIASTTNPVMKSLTLYTSSSTLNSVESSDSGNYTCTVSIESEIEVSARANIIIGK